MLIYKIFAAHVSGKGLSSSASQSSLRGSFPECILEDSGFEEPQEFRTRCSSLAGSLQRKPGEGVIMGPIRRRHSSAPNHVQPSDADKNRTMLFQVEKSSKISVSNKCLIFIKSNDMLYFCWCPSFTVSSVAQTFLISVFQLTLSALSVGRTQL